MWPIINKLKLHLNFFKKIPNNQDAFTLIEVLVSLVLLAIILTTFFGFFSQSMLFSNQNDEDLVAYNLTTQTLNIFEEKYQNTLNNTETTIKCDNYPNGYPQELKDVLQTSACYYQKNQKNYYPEITITFQASSKYAGLPPLYVVHVQMFNSNNPSNRKLLSETFGYIRGM